MLKHIGSNWTQNLLQIAVMMVLTPFMIGELGDQAFGVWLAIGAITGYLHLLVLGVPMASVRHIAEGVGRGDALQTRRAISTSLGLCVGLGVLALVAGALLYPAFDRGLVGRWADITPEARHDARLAYAVNVLTVATGFVMRLPYALYDAHEEFVARNAIQCVGLLVRLTLVLVLLSLRTSVTTLAVVVLAQAAIEFVAALVVLRRRRPELRFGLGDVDRSMVRSIFGFSIWATLLNFGTQLAYRTDAIVIGAYLDGAAITEFDVGNKFFDPLTSFMLGIGMVVMPFATRMSGAGKLDELQKVFLAWSKISLSVVLAVGLYLMLLGPEFLGWWVAPDYEQRSGPTLQVLMLSFVVFLPIRAVAVPALLGLDDPKKPALGILLMSAINLGLSLALVRSMGILGVAIGTAVPNLIFAVWVLRLACHKLDTPVRAYLGYVATRVPLAALPAAGVLLVAKYGLDARGFWPLLLAGLAFVAVYCGGQLAFAWRGDPYVDVSGRANALLARLGWRPGS